MGWGPGGVPQSHPGRLGSLLALLSRRKRRSWVPGNQPDRLPGCQHLRNAKPSLRQGWVLRAGCSAGDSAGPPRRGVQGAAPPVPLSTARHSTTRHPACHPADTAGPSAGRYMGVQGGGPPGTGCRLGWPGLRGCWWGGELCGAGSQRTSMLPSRLPPMGATRRLHPCPNLVGAGMGARFPGIGTGQVGAQGWEVGAEPGSAPLTFSP